MLEALTETLIRDAEGKDALLIAGPTASGKSALAIAVAKATGGLVVNADSMQIYEGIRLLTARPTPEEEGEVEHRLYGVIDPRTAFSAGDYVRMIAPLLAATARKWPAGDHRRRHRALFPGADGRPCRGPGHSPRDHGRS